MDKIKKIGKGLLIGLSFIFMVGVWGSFHFMPSVSYLVNQAVTLVPQPSINNPVPNCSECLITKGLRPQCVSICLQEVIFQPYAKKSPLVIQCMAGN